MKRGLIKAIMIIASLAMICSCASLQKYDEAVLAERMQDFIINISEYAQPYAKQKHNDPNFHFIIIPQNGGELIFNNADQDHGLRQSFVNVVDGFGMEELFYDRRAVDDVWGRMPAVRAIHDLGKKIMVADYVSTETYRTESIQKNKNEGYISFQRVGFPMGKDNYDYLFIPETPITDSNTDDINVLSDAMNYLYLISSDEFARGAGTVQQKKQTMINAIAATNYDVILIDLFFYDTDNDSYIIYTPDDIKTLKRKPGGQNRLVIAYMNIGSAENYRYYFQKGWKKGRPSWLKKDYEDYPDEFFVEYWNPEWQNIIYGDKGDNYGNDSYTKKIIDAGFDGAYLDNVEAYWELAN